MHLRYDRSETEILERQTDCDVTELRRSNESNALGRNRPQMSMKNDAADCSAGSQKSTDGEYHIHPTMKGRT